MIVTVNGCFDLLHVGHIRFLKKASEYGELIVLLNSDLSIKRLKGPTRPILPQNERIEMLTSLACVSKVILFDDDTPLRVLEEIKPDIHIKTTKSIPQLVEKEKEVVERNGGKIIFIEADENSSTDLIKRIKQLD
ncbi:MAG: adenylyltransferase/cytidyltransferase family protein [archaeon]|jgi:rfaE bifunctional protein nucleotidyltransferase chain/domain